MTRQHEIFKYACHAAAYLISGLSAGELKILNNIILFGSSARLSASEESDIDIFFDLSAPKKSQLSLRSKLNKLAEQFYLTNTAFEFRSRDINNEISIKVGKLDEWEDLAQSISSHGIVLYGKYMKAPPGLKSYTVLSWEMPGKAKGALLNKIYGYRIGKKSYPGMLKKLDGKKIGGGTIMVPGKNRDIFIEVLEKYKINYSRYDVWM